MAWLSACNPLWQTAVTELALAAYAQGEQRVREELGVSAWPDLLAVMQQSAPVAQISQLHGLQTYYGELDIRGGHCCGSYPA